MNPKLFQLIFLLLSICTISISINTLRHSPQTPSPLQPSIRFGLLPLCHAADFSLDPLAKILLHIVQALELGQAVD
jgi:hypothetical protein